MSVGAQVVTFEVEDRELATVELEYSIAIEMTEIEVVTQGEQGPPGVGAAEISDDPGNQIRAGTDNKLFVPLTDTQWSATDW